MLKRAIKIAEKAHAGQFEKDGGLYLRHPIRLLYILRNEDELIKTVAMLHDVVEDSSVSLDDLQKELKWIKLVSKR